MKFTQQFPEAISDLKFATATWGGMFLAAFLMMLFTAGMQFASWQFAQISILVGLPLIYGAYRVASANDSELTSLCAVMIGAGCYGVIAGSFVKLTSDNNVYIMALQIMAVTSLFWFTEIKTPGLIAESPMVGVCLGLIPVILATLIVTWIRGELWLSGVQLVYAYFVGSMLVQYRFAWAGKHTLDNAIDFALEFMFIIFKLIPLRWSQRGEK